MPRRIYRARAGLGQVGQASARVELSHPLGDGWWLQNPIAVRHELARSQLRVRAPAESGELLRLSLRRSAAQLWARLDVTWSRAEIGSEVAVLLRPVGADGEDDWPVVSLYASGGGGMLRRRARIARDDTWSLEVEGAARDDRTTVLLLADLERRQSVSLALDHEVRRTLAAAGDPGTEWELVIAAVETHGQTVGQMAELVVHGVALGGVELELERSADAVVAEPWAVWARGQGAPPRRRLASTELRDNRQLAALVRLEPAVVPRLAELFGEPEMAEFLARVWSWNAHTHTDDTAVQERLLALPLVERMAVDRQPTIRVARGEVRWLHGDVSGAQADLRVASEQAARLGLDGWQDRFLARALLAEIALALDRPEEALAHARAAVASPPDEELGRTLLARRPALAERADLPRWRELFQRAAVAGPRPMSTANRPAPGSGSRTSIPITRR